MSFKIIGSGPTADRTFTFPDANATVLTTNAAVTAAQGGTGIASYAIGDLLYASASTTLSKLAGVATGQALVSGGVGVPPAWSASLALSSTLSVNNGAHHNTSGKTGALTVRGTANQDVLQLYQSDPAGLVQPFMRIHDTDGRVSFGSYVTLSGDLDAVIPTSGAVPSMLAVYADINAGSAVVIQSAGAVDAIRSFNTNGTLVFSVTSAGVLSITDTTEASGASTGSIVTAGGANIAKTLKANTGLFASGIGVGGASNVNTDSVFAGHIKPSTDVTYDLGDGAKRWNNAAINTINAANSFVTNVTETSFLDSTSGNDITFRVHAGAAYVTALTLKQSTGAALFAGLIQIGGATSGSPALKKNGTLLEARLADDSAYANVRAANVLFSALLNAGTSNLLISVTAPTISSGFGTSPSVPSNNGTAAFTVNVGTGGAASSGVIALPAAATGWVCVVENITAQAANRANERTVQTASSTTSVTVQNQLVSTGAAQAWAASDILRLICFAY